MLLVCSSFNKPCAAYCWVAKTGFDPCPYKNI
jgi:hypothetical protein